MGGSLLRMAINLLPPLPRLMKKIKTIGVPLAIEMGATMWLRPSLQGGKYMGLQRPRGVSSPRRSALPLHSNDRNNDNNNNNNGGGTHAVVDGKKSAEDGNQPTPTPPKANENEVITIGSSSDEESSIHASKVRYLVLKV
jgi:hypothetical protein